MESAVANADVNAKDKDGWTALVPAKWYTSGKIVSLLKKRAQSSRKQVESFWNHLPGWGSPSR